MTTTLLDIELGARTLWQEARGEPASGQAAVAHVLKNRVIDGRWGKSLGEVCTSEYHGIFQFSGWSRNDPNRVPSFHLADGDPVLAKMRNILSAALSQSVDPTGGALFYFANSLPVPPSWAETMTLLGVWGGQSFFTDRPNPNRTSA